MTTNTPTDAAPPTAGLDTEASVARDCPKGGLLFFAGLNGATRVTAGENLKRGDVVVIRGGQAFIAVHLA